MVEEKRRAVDERPRQILHGGEERVGEQALSALQLSVLRVEAKIMLAEALEVLALELFGSEQRSQFVGA